MQLIGEVALIISLFNTLEFKVPECLKIACKVTLIDAKYNKSEKTASRDVLGWVYEKEWKSVELPKVTSKIIHYCQKSIDLLSETYIPHLKFKDGEVVF